VPFQHPARQQNTVSLYDVAMKRRMLCLLLAVQGLCLAAGSGARILIVTDLEGVGGVNNADEQLLPGQRRYEESRRLLTGEVNAAVEGAFLAVPARW
jgi:hypothetical protein